VGAYAVGIKRRVGNGGLRDVPFLNPVTPVLCRGHCTAGSNDAEDARTLRLTMAEAIRREEAIKRWKREFKLNLIERDNPAWQDLAVGLGFPSLPKTLPG